jgi:K+-sensing histidine kinase KdpD/CheY-like chemotaxis protein
MASPLLLREKATFMRSSLLRSRSPLVKYGVAVAGVGVMITFKWITPRLGQDAPFLMMTGPTVLAAWYGGLGPGLVAALLGTISADYFFEAPAFSLRESPVAIYHDLVFGSMDALIAVLVARVQVARRRAEAAARRIQGIYTVSVALGGTRTIQDVADVILHETAAVLDASAVAIYVTSERGETLRLLTHLGRDPHLLGVASDQTFQEVPLSIDAPLALAARNRTVIAIESPREMQRRFPERFRALEAHLSPKALMVAPMIVHGHVVGVLATGFLHEQTITPDDRSWAQALAQDCGMAVERTRLFERERDARIQAQEAARAKDAFLAVVSTELRAPLTTIVGWAHMLRRERSTDRGRLEHGLDVIERSAHAEAKLVDDILDMSRIAGRTMDFEVKSIDLAPLVRSLVDRCRVQATAKGVHLELRSAVPALVMADGDRIRQALKNALSHAIRFTPPGGHVTVDLTKREHGAILRIEDDGKGLSPSQLARVLEPFRSGQDSDVRRDRGLGLGLAIANYVVREHKGSFTVDSPGMGRGTTITMSLPVAEPTAGRLGVAANGRTRQAPLAGRRVLVVDDDTDAREALSEMLAAEGADVRSAPGAEVALDEVREFSPHVIVTDTDIDRDYGFIRRLRALPPPLATIPALALTARSAPQEGLAAIAAGYQRQLAKPPEPRTLTETVVQLGNPAT